MSFETYALVRDRIRARALSPIRVKGVGREIVPYVVEGWVGNLAGKPTVIREHVAGLDLFLDVDAIDEFAVERAKRCLVEALAALIKRHHEPALPPSRCKSEPFSSDHEMPSASS